MRVVRNEEILSSFAQYRAASALPRVSHRLDRMAEKPSSSLSRVVVRSRQTGGEGVETTERKQSIHFPGGREKYEQWAVSKHVWWRAWGGYLVLASFVLEF